MGLAAAAAYRNKTRRAGTSARMNMAAPRVSTGSAAPVSAGFPQRSPVERVAASDWLNDAAKVGGGWVGTAVQTPARIAETPFSLVGAVANFVSGGALNRVGGMGQVVKDTPVLGPVLGAVDWGVNTVMNSGTALLNSTDADLIRKYGRMDDSFVIPDLGERTEGGFAGFVSGLPLFGAPFQALEAASGQTLYGRQKTLGELKAELRTRGFTDDDFRDLADGRRGIFDYGDRLVNDSAAVSMAASLVIDPTNLLFAPGIIPKTLARLGLRSAKASTIPDGIRGAMTGTYTDTTPMALGQIVQRESQLMAQSIRAQAARTGANLRNLTPGAIPRGLANFYLSPQWFTRKGYLKRAATLYGAQTIAVMLPNQITGPIGDFARSMESQKPLSDNTGFIMAAAMMTPVSQIARDIKADIRGTAFKTVGVGGMAPVFKRETGIDMEEFMRRTNGRGEAHLYGYALDLVKDRLDPAIKQAMASMSEASTRAEIVGDNLRLIVDAMLETGQITPRQIMRRAKERFQTPKELQTGDPEYWLPHIGYLDRTKEGMVTRFDWDTDIWIEQMNDYAATLNPVAEAFQMNGRAVLGMSRTYTKEHMDVLMSAVRLMAEGSTIQLKYVRDFLSRNRVLFRMEGSRDFEKYLGEYRSDKVPLEQFLWELQQTRDHVNTPTNGMYFASDESMSFQQLMETPMAHKGQALLDDLRTRIAATLDETGQVRPDRQAQNAYLLRRLERAYDWEWTRADMANAATRQQMQDALAAEIRQYERSGLGDTEAVTLLREQSKELNNYRYWNRKVREANLAKRRDRLMDEEGIPIPPMDATWDSAPEFFADEVKALEAEVRQFSPNYTVKQGPELSTVTRPTDRLPELMIRSRSALAESLYTLGPASPLGNFVELLLAPVSGAKMQKEAQQAVFDELVGKGVSAASITRWLGAMRAETVTALANERRGIRFFPTITALPAATVNKIARDVFTPDEINIIGRDSAHAVLDRASNRWSRAARARVRAGSRNRLLNAMDQGVLSWRSGALPGSSGARFVAGTFYPLFRYMVDIRYHAMNWYEANILGGIRNGIFNGSQREPGSAFEKYSGERPGSLTNEAGTGVEHGQVNFFADPNETGWQYTNRMISTRISQSFDKERIESGEQVLRDMWDTDPSLLELRRRLPDATPRDIVEMLDEKWNNFDVRGVKKTVEDGYRELYKDDPEALANALGRLDRASQEQLIRARMEINPQLAYEAATDMAIIQRLHEVNKKNYDDLVGVFLGNTQRSTLERLANSYWLYWPISYQIKATKWLIGVLFSRAFGNQTNMLGAFQYDQMRQLFNENLARSPELQQDLEESRVLWETAMMFFPIMPDDIGVSLSRGTRAILSQDINPDPNARFSVFDEIAKARDPVGALGYIMTIGPVYTAELLNRMKGRIFPDAPQDTVQTSVFPGTPAQPDAPVDTPFGAMPEEQTAGSAFEQFLEEQAITSEQAIVSGPNNQPLGG